VTSLDPVRAAHPDWTIRRDVGQDWVSWTAQRARVITSPALDELAARLDLADGVAASDSVIAAIELLAEHHQPITMTPGDLRALLARYQRRLHELLDAVGQDVRETGS
jgi:hypothetical protein